MGLIENHSSHPPDLVDHPGDTVVANRHSSSRAIDHTCRKHGPNDKCTVELPNVDIFGT